ncbi:MAG: hypothetical protein JHC26_01455 [Thermofilum sp.]|jgi:hypothetical protein|uniref:hypothetical protein n=1 Tax=Thermofilum sp. TaxID=1961369 RepID=UPI00258BF718|nr:hypothetical protein [Thermofilum sp.]MCI4407727.1 hypothetical protein [Thermofilum sp.]
MARKKTERRKSPEKEVDEETLARELAMIERVMMYETHRDEIMSLFNMVLLYVARQMWGEDIVKVEPGRPRWDVVVTRRHNGKEYVEKIGEGYLKLLDKTEQLLDLLFGEVKGKRESLEKYYREYLEWSGKAKTLRHEVIKGRVKA